MKMKLNKIVAAAMFFLALTSRAQAELLDGQPLDIFFFTLEPLHMATVGANTSTVVGPGTELMNFGGPGLGFVDIDFSDTNVLITSRSDRLGYEFASLSFSDDQGTIPGFYSITVNPATNMPDDSYHVSLFDPNSVIIRFSGGGLQDKELFLDLTVVPEPTTAALIIVSVAFLVVGRRRF